MVYQPPDLSSRATHTVKRNDIFTYRITQKYFQDFFSCVYRPIINAKDIILSGIYSSNITFVTSLLRRHDI